MPEAVGDLERQLRGALRQLAGLDCVANRHRRHLGVLAVDLRDDFGWASRVDEGVNPRVVRVIDPAIDATDLDGRPTTVDEHHVGGARLVASGIGGD